ncbi:MAG TPA: acyl-CoA dehydrogenase family protein, partial [Kofleriaceae bacterium]|nr:acyl-CoA dehydrogenase family protein [Kofleriaceae bacterium]
MNRQPAAQIEGFSRYDVVPKPAATQYSPGAAAAGRACRPMPRADMPCSPAMDLAYSPEHLKFRDEVRAFIAESFPAHLRPKAEIDAHFEHHEIMEWHRILYKKGWAAPHWPVAHGGPGLDATSRFILSDELEQANAPS